MMDLAIMHKKCYNVIMAKRPGITFRYENTLLVSRKRLQAEYVDAPETYRTQIDADDFYNILATEHVSEKIHQQIENVHALYREKAAKVARPAIWAVQLSVAGPDVLDSVHSIDSAKVETPIHNPDLLKPHARVFWTAAARAGFRPEVSLNGGYQDAGLWLRLHELDELTTHDIKITGSSSAS